VEGIGREAAVEVGNVRWKGAVNAKRRMKAINTGKEL